MFTIDLLKGQGLPTRANLKLLALVTVAFSVLIFVAVFMFGSYVCNRIVLATQLQALNSCDCRFDGLRNVLDERQILADRRKSLNSCLTEVVDVLNHETQWSEFLQIISRCLPENLIVDQLEVKIRQRRIEVPCSSDLTRKITISVPARSVAVRLHCEPRYDGDQSVQDFQHKLLDSEVFRKNVKSIVITSREPGVVNNREVINYKLNCIFKTHSL